MLEVVRGARVLKRAVRGCKLVQDERVRKDAATPHNEVSHYAQRAQDALVQPGAV